MSAKAALGDIERRYGADPAFAHLRTPGIRYVPGFGACPPDVLVVGEAPGATENTHGRPFCGASGRALEQLLWKHAKVSWIWRGKITGARVPPGCAEGVPPNAYVTNVLKYRPPGNRTPYGAEVEASLPYLRAEWAVLGGTAIRAVLAIGGTAKAALAPGLPSMHSCATEPMPFGAGILIPMFHPAFALRNTGFRETYEKHWKKVGDLLAEEGII